MLFFCFSILKTQIYKEILKCVGLFFPSNNKESIGIPESIWRILSQKRKKQVFLSLILTLDKGLVPNFRRFILRVFYPLRVYNPNNLEGDNLERKSFWLKILVRVLHIFLILY